MSELVQKHDHNAIRWKLLTGTSALVLITYISAGQPAKAEDPHRPAVWIELGGQLSRLQDSQEAFAPPFVALTPPNFTPPQNAERAPLYGIDASGRISIRPDNSDWDFSISIRYGRASKARHTRHQSYPAPYTAYARYRRTRNGVVHSGTATSLVNPVAARFTDAVVKETESHTLLDFMAGKDFGVGLFGHDAPSSLNVGVRIAQFTSKSRATLKENPDWQFKTHLVTFNAHGYDYYGIPYSRQITQQYVLQRYHSFSGAFQAERSFSGLGPSISWNSSVPFAGDPQRGALEADWGVNAAVLFGRQKVKTQHQTTSQYGQGYYRQERVTLYQHGPYFHTRVRNVIVPNIGGFAGISFKYDSAKVSFGYRADFFFGAIDGGIDTRKTNDRDFFGPYASISIGLGG